MQSTLEAALAYAAQGWKVFPLQPNTKIPFPGTNGVKDATDDAETIKAWWKVHPDANLALACGAPSGIWVVDIDVGHKAGVDGFASLAGRNITLPETIYQDTPSGGRHYLYAINTDSSADKKEPPRNKNNFMPGIDIRGTGYYIVLAPSVIDGKQYVMGGHSHGLDDLAEYPDSMRPEPPGARISMPWDAPPPRPTGNTVRDRAAKYLHECDPAVQGMGGHNALLWAAQAMVVGFDLSDSEALELLWNEYNPRCQPPWDRGSARDAKDFERKVAEARKHPIKEHGWLLNETKFNAADDALDFAGAELASRFLAQNQEREIESLVTPPLTAIPDELLNPPGLVGDIARWMNDTAGCYQPVLALGASLVFCGALFGRKVKDESNGRTNIYGMGVGHSSAGKDHAAKCIAKIIQAARCEGLLGGEVTSDTAIEICLKDSPSKLFVMDEVGHFLRTINQAKGTTPHLKTIVPMFMKLFSAANSLYIGKQRVTGGPANQIDQPCVCIWGITSPQILFDNMTREELEGGWTARNLVFITDTRPEYRFTKESVVPDHIATLVQAWFSRTIPPPASAGNLAHARAWQMVVPTSPDALDVFAKFGHKAHERMLKADKSGDVCNYLWGKALENARRIALIVACGENFDGIEIGATEAKYGCQLVEWLIYRLSEAVHNNVAETGWEHDKQRIYKLIAGCEADGMSKTELTRKTQWVKDRKMRNDYVEDLKDAGMIVYGPAPEHGGRQWLWATKWLSRERLTELRDMANGNS